RRNGSQVKIILRKKIDSRSQEDRALNPWTMLSPRRNQQSGRSAGGGSREAPKDAREGKRRRPKKMTPARDREPKEKALNSVASAGV
ncbi:MAG: hypothetical protein J0H21_08020, partial [Rhizobiales bacterium]|nr:hypothetical protein [Hyphomicrobiales bacterium]